MWFFIYEELQNISREDQQKKSKKNVKRKMNEMSCQALTYAFVVSLISFCNKMKEFTLLNADFT